MTLRRLIPSIALLGLGLGCLAERSHERDPRLASEITRQERWAQDSVAGRATPEDLEKIRSGDQQTVSLGRKQLRKLVASVDRGTWIREATVQSLREDGDDPALVADFEKAGQTRTEALQAADELAQALAETRDGVTLADLRKALDSLRRARDGEAKLARELGAAAQGPSGDTAPAGKAPAAATSGKPAPVNPLAKLSTVALPVPRPFIAAAARYLFGHPGEKLTGFAADDAAGIRAQLAELESHPPAAPKPALSSEAHAETAAPPADAGGPQAGGARAATAAGDAAAAGTAAAADPEPPRAGPADLLNIARDAQKLIAKRGPPKSFSARADGLFALRYQETRTCGVDSCLSDVDYLFDSSGKLVREEATPRR